MLVSRMQQVLMQGRKCSLNTVLHLSRRNNSFSTSFGLSDRTKIILFGTTCFAASAIGHHAYNEWRREEDQRNMLRAQLIFDDRTREVVPTTNVHNFTVPLDKLKAMPVSRRVLGPVGLPPGIRFTLFQYQTCPFCCKVRSYLDYYGIPYDVVEVNPVLRQQLKISEYKKVPILYVWKDEEALKNVKGNLHKDKDEDKIDRFIDESMQLTDSTLIISLISSFFTCNPDMRENLNAISTLYPLVSYASLEDNRTVAEVVNKYFLMKADTMDEREYKETVKTLSEERKWREWADKTLVHTLSPNVYRTLGESLHTFEVFSFVGDWHNLFPTWERLLVVYVGAFAMWIIGKRLQKRHLLKPDVRESLYDAVRQWIKALNGRPFMGGETPNLADISVYGVLNSIEGCDAFSDVLMNTNIRGWYFRMKEAVSMKHGYRTILQQAKSLH